MADDAQNPNSSAYNWHPAVHSDHFDETLYFVMVRLHEPLHRPVAEQIRDVLNGAGVEHACAYPLFGWWDALVRVWLTPLSYRRFIDVLQESVKHKSSDHNIEDYRGFRTNEIRYFWRGMDENLLAPDKEMKATIASNTADIEVVAANPEPMDTAAWKRLKDAELLFTRPSMPPGGVKFYTCLERTSDNLPQQREVDAILRAMSSTSMGDADTLMIERSTLYCGDGTLADYLVRSVADSYDDVLSLAESFDIHLKETGLRPMTLLVANPAAVYESDSVNDTRHLNRSDDSTIELLDLNPKVFVGILAPHRHDLNGLVVEACELAKNDNSLRDLLLGILRATAMNDKDEFRESLSYLLNFEPEFKSRLIREFGEVFGGDWLRTIMDLCAASPKWRKHAEEKMSADLRDWTLGTYLLTARAVSELNPQFRGRLVSQLGGNWDGAAADLLNLRNDLSHGRVYEMPQLDLYDEQMVAYLKRVMSAAGFWWRSRIDDGGE